MGVKHFYSWYKNNFSSCVIKNTNDVDILAIDMNGLFHFCAQRIYKYGNSSAHLLYHSKMQLLPKTNLSLFKNVCEKIESLRSLIKPKKTIILCVDGIAGLGKMNQQRQRRFKTDSINKNNHFNPNCFTPGTKIMDHLTKYIDWYIRTMITVNPEWQNLEIIFSNEKVPGEGEHKIMNYLKKYASQSEKICIYGLDADLIMLGIILPFNNLLIAREPEYGFIEYVNIKEFRERLLNAMKWDQDDLQENEQIFNKNLAINDFILLSFLVGNDFIPTIPTINILDGAMDIILNIYIKNCKIYGHLVKEKESSNELMFNIEALSKFFLEFSKIEKEILEKKYNSQQPFFPDPLVIKNMKLINQKYEINMEIYKKDYYNLKFPSNTNIENIVSEYLNGILWTLNYYKKGMPDWIWFYPFFYGPFLSDFYDILLHNYKQPNFILHEPVCPFLQLLMVLPPFSKDLVPEPLNHLMNENSSLGQYFPNTFEIDMTGKKKDWEGIVILPQINLENFKNEYFKYENQLSNIDKKRNIFGKNFIYHYDVTKTDLFSSFYGNIPECPVAINIINF